MGLLAAHINDAGISVLDADKVLYRESGVALLDDDNLTTGAEAVAQARLKPRRIQNSYWSDLRTAPLADRHFEHLSAADLASRQLEHIWKRVAGPQDRAIIAVPAYMGKENLSLLLGITAELKVPVIAMVDAAVAATRREYQGAVPVHVDLSLHSTLLTRISQSGQAQVDRSSVVSESGVLALYEAWIALIAEAFVQQSRFDPLHTAETEQMLQDKLPDWLATASAQENVALQIEYRGIKHDAELESLEFVAAAAPIYHSIVSNVRALYRAEESPALQLSERAARMPGLADILSARVGGETYLQEPGATARGLLSRCRDMQADTGAVSLIRQLPWDQAAVESTSTDVVHTKGQPTHLLFDNHAFSIDMQALTLGSKAGGGERYVELRQDMPGVSRRHCSVSRENGQCIVRDYSRYGTFLNGHRIDGSAVLQIGDLIRLGTPGFEMRLITTASDDGS